MTEQEFRAALREQEGKLLRVAWAVLGHEADAWDALQEAAEVAFRSRRSLRGGAPAFPAWMRRILINKCISILRQRQRVVPVDPVRLPEGPALPDLAQGSAEARDLWALVRLLEPDQRQVVALHYLGDLSLAEIATGLGLPEGTVKSRLHRALSRLRRKLTEGRGTQDA